MSDQSRMSANDKGGNEVNPGFVHRSPGILNHGRVKLLKTSARRSFEEGCVTSHRLTCSSLLLNNVFKIAKHVMKKERSDGERPRPSNPRMNG